MRRRHDPFLKRLYRLGARDALTLFLPDLAEKFDWDQWQWIDKELPILGRRQPRSVVADLVGQTRDRQGRYLKVLVHPELQMTPDDDMDWRALQYNAGLLLQEGNRDTRVITVVFYHCPGTGGIRRHRLDLDFYDEPSLLGLTYWSVGLGDLDAEQYAERDNPMGWALAAWMRQQRESRVELRLQLLQKILRFGGGEAYQELLLDTVQSYYRLSGRERKVEEQFVSAGRYGEVQAMGQTWLERQRARAEREGRQEGRQEGRHEGRQEGRQEGEAAALQRSALLVIRSRFQDVPAWILSQIEAVADPTLLEELIRRASRAASLDEIEPLLRS